MANQVDKAVADALKKAREASGLSQSEVAEALGTPQPNVSRWENGKSHVTYSNLAAMAHVYKTQPSAIIDEALQDAVPETIKTRARRLEREIKARQSQKGD